MFAFILWRLFKENIVQHTDTHTSTLWRRGKRLNVIDLNSLFSVKTVFTSSFFSADTNRLNFFARCL